MVSKEQLEQMEKANIKEADPAALADLLEVEIRGETPEERLESYLAQVKNPYCFRVGKTAVRISFDAGEKPLEEKLKNHFKRLKR